ncbi:unnamed protein product, partial [Closterium sp. Naga37s-1]
MDAYDLPLLLLLQSPIPPPPPNFLQANIDRRKAAHNGDQWPMGAYDLPSLLLSANIDRRKAAHNGDQWPMDAYDLPQLLLSVLMPPYPCPAEERVGAWGDGGKWVCMLPTAIREKPVVY